MYTPISVVIITYNEINNIARCIASVQAIADEVVVIDSFSTDGTQQLATSLGAKVIEHVFEGYAQQKNWGNALAAHSYVLSLDADEQLSEELINVISNLKQTQMADGYYINRLTSFCGQWIRHSGWYPDEKLRLWNKNKGEWKGLNVHEQYVLQPNTSTKLIREHILHYSFVHKEQYHLQQHKFTTLGAIESKQLGKRANGINLYVNPVFKFIKNYVFRLGFLDGKNGLYLCYYNAYYTYIKYKKLKEL
ncbi:MAG: glycosyltransferase family 2 protein [Bacteroidia bacterium]